MRTPRLNAAELAGIKEAFIQCFPKGSHLYLFGSRSDPKKKGGDIDLYIEAPFETADQVLDAKEKFLTKLFVKIGEQKVDVIIKFQTDLPIHSIAKNEGIKLI